MVDLGCFASINYTHRFESDILHQTKSHYVTTNNNQCRSVKVNVVEQADSSRILLKDFKDAYSNLKQFNVNEYKLNASCFSESRRVWFNPPVLGTEDRGFESHLSDHSRE